MGFALRTWFVSRCVFQSLLVEFKQQYPRVPSNLQDILLLLHSLAIVLLLRITNSIGMLAATNLTNIFWLLGRFFQW